MQKNTNTNQKQQSTYYLKKPQTGINIISDSSYLNSYLIWVLSREILYRRNNSLSNQLTIGGRSLLLDKLCLLTADWGKQARERTIIQSEMLQ